MIKFRDGPAAGQTLMIRSAPDFLRVVRGKFGEWDALDQWNDAPTADETIYVYRRASRIETIHLQMSPRSGSGFYPVAAYRHVETDGERVRDQSEWSTFMRTEPFPPPTEEPT